MSDLAVRPLGGRTRRRRRERDQGLRPALLGSVALHLGLVAAAWIATHWLPQPKLPPLKTAVPVTVVTQAPTPDVRPTERAPQPQPPRAPEPEPEAAAPPADVDAPTPPAPPTPAPPAPKPKPAPPMAEPRPEPKPTPPPKPVAKSAPKPAPEPKAAPRPRPEPVNSKPAIKPEPAIKPPPPKPTATKPLTAPKPAASKSPQKTPPRPQPSAKPSPAPPKAAPKPAPAPAPSLDLDDVSKSLPKSKPGRTAEKALNLDDLASSLPRGRGAPKPSRKGGLDLAAIAADDPAAATRSGGARRAAGARGPAKVEASEQTHPPLGAAKGLSADALGALKEKLNRLWNPNCGVEGAGAVVVRVEMKLSPEGRLTGPARVVSRSGEASADVLDASSARALTAVARGEPYTELPRESYASWKDIVVRFNAKEACSGR